MMNWKAIYSVRGIAFFLLFCFFAPSPSLAVECFNQGGWVIDCATDTGPNPRDIKVSVEGVSVGNFSELKIIHEIVGQGFPQIFSVKGMGALRPVLPPPGKFGGTFYTSGYWDCDPNIGFIQNMAILRLDIRLDPNDPTILTVEGKASNLSSFKATDFTLRFFPPTAQSVRVKVTYTLVATRDFCVDQTRQNQHEGFRIARIASNFLSSETHDSNQARYTDIFGTIVCADLLNENSFIFPDPFPMEKPKLFLIHSDALPRNTPTLLIKFLMPKPGKITPQGFVAASSDPNDDNVDLWGNWDRAKSAYTKGETIRQFEYNLKARPPEPLPCD